ncbi:DUF4823 domain-containing protein [Yersinia enterocolitica]|uniref:DUF4823 domain-containing protein n=1 Tax=Yersinia enterocolitica TaxID=630 RepID=UPI001C6105D9|nr:DUF4823 domain-containing protein [Yersinia enterocolitica]MBW5820707.1 DUF4823 domain-containing protein [Yersinia enterocolitica]MBW5850360.1 DUF4823 domain-containing protein [Yersinia enterocolitica]MBW5869136.1 DUF4823 domain-containing protein [Yersinia enterocolitica]MBW5876434.1 DUF4823 domain-containing protein [Yersinia enterocolitica]
MKRLAIIGVVLISVSGCSAKYSATDVQPSTELLVKGKPVVISTPADGVYEAQRYAGSGDATALSVRAAFLIYTDNTEVIANCDKFICLKENHKISDGYYAVPQILHWEDRATEWSGKPDIIAIKITVYNAASDNIISSTIINGKSKWATFGGDHPQDLLAKPVSEYISSLY